MHGPFDTFLSGPSYKALFTASDTLVMGVDLGKLAVGDLLFVASPKGEARDLVSTTVTNAITAAQRTTIPADRFADSHVRHDRAHAMTHVGIYLGRGFVADIYPGCLPRLLSLSSFASGTVDILALRHDDCAARVAAMSDTDRPNIERSWFEMAARVFARQSEIKYASNQEVVEHVARTALRGSLQDALAEQTAFHSWVCTNFAVQMLVGILLERRFADDRRSMKRRVDNPEATDASLNLPSADHVLPAELLTERYRAENGFGLVDIGLTRFDRSKR